MIKASQNPFACSPYVQIGDGSGTSTIPYRQNFTYSGDAFTIPASLIVTDVVSLTSPATYVTYTRLGTTLTVTSYAEDGDEFKILGNQPL